MEIDLSELSAPDLLKLWSGTMSELQNRELVRTGNNPVGDLAEAIVHEHFGGERGSFNQKAWDVLTADGERIQVKALRRAGKRKRRNLSAIRDSEYDSVVVVMFNGAFELTGAVKFPRETVETLFPVRVHVNGRVVCMTDALLRHPSVIKVDLAAAFERISFPQPQILEAAAVAASLEA